MQCEQLWVLQTGVKMVFTAVCTSKWSLHRGGEVVASSQSLLLLKFLSAQVQNLWLIWNRDGCWLVSLLCSC